MNQNKNFQNVKNQIDYNEILINLRKRSELAYKKFLLSDGTNILEYASELSESILEALDMGLCYPEFDILQYLKEVGKIDQKRNSIKY